MKRNKAKSIRLTTESSEHRTSKIAFFRNRKFCLKKVKRTMEDSRNKEGNKTEIIHANGKFSTKICKI